MFTTNLAHVYYKFTRNCMHFYSGTACFSMFLRYFILSLAYIIRYGFLNFVFEKHSRPLAFILQNERRADWHALLVYSIIRIGLVTPDSLILVQFGIIIAYTVAFNFNACSQEPQRFQFHCLHAWSHIFFRFILHFE